jgi:tetracycline resistance efflux pump
MAVALAGIRVQRALTGEQIGASVASGVRAMGEPLGVLLLAWALGDLIEASPAPQWLAGVLGGHVEPAAVPLLAFATACLMSFASGSSWFTMGAMLPVAVPVAAALASSDPLVVVLTVAAVMDGALFGDHASPISDTTVLAALGSGCDVMLHTRTQLPYAVVTAVLAGMGFLLAPGTALGVVWVAVAVGAFVLIRLGHRTPGVP